MTFPNLHCTNNKGEINMYNNLTIKCDILKLGSRRLDKPEHIQTFIKDGYNIYESYRIFDNGHKLNVMLGLKHGKNYLIVSDVESKSYQTEEFKGTSLIPAIRYLNKDSLNKLSSSLRNGTINKIDLIEHENINGFMNRFEICIYGLKLKTMALCAILMTSVLALMSLI